MKNFRYGILGLALILSAIGKAEEPAGHAGETNTSASTGETAPSVDYVSKSCAEVQGYTETLFRPLVRKNVVKLNIPNKLGERGVIEFFEDHYLNIQGKLDLIKKQITRDDKVYDCPKEASSCAFILAELRNALDAAQAKSIQKLEGSKKLALDCALEAVKAMQGDFKFNGNSPRSGSGIGRTYDGKVGVDTGTVIVPTGGSPAGLGYGF